jgi:ectoine hydroxylase-related dioxygenase (phytanoyl-CoA dioxygenase family)
MLSASDLGRYEDTGYVIARSVIGAAEIEALRREWSRLWAEIDSRRANVSSRGHAALGATKDRIDGVYLASEPFRELSHGVLTRIASAVLGSAAVFFKDKLISKGPGTFGYGPHQDFPYWTQYRVPPHSLLTLMVALDPNDAENGAVELWPGRYDAPLTPDPNDPRDIDPRAVDPGQAVLIPLEAGDVLAFHSLIPHRSGPNRSSRYRRVYVPVYVSEQYAGASREADAFWRERAATESATS